MDFTSAFVFSICNPKPSIITTKELTYIFKPPQDPVNISISPPDSLLPIGFKARYFAYWNDTIIDKGAKLRARKYDTKGQGLFYGGNLKFEYKKYKATDYCIRMTISFLGCKKDKKQRAKAYFMEAI